MLRSFVGAVAVAALVATPCLSGATTTAFTLGGTSQLADVGQAIPPLDLSGVLSGKYDTGPAVSVPYPATVLGMDHSIAVGAERLVAGISSTPGDKVAVGISQGAIVIAEAKRRLMALPADQRPGPEELTFVAIADPTRGGHGALAQMGYQTPDTPYDTTYVTREYDGFADLPDRFNLLAIVNAAAGIAYVHSYYGELPDDIPAKNITTTVNGAGATVTDVLIPNAHLPLLQPLRDLGWNMDGVEKILKPMVDAGYSRNDVERDGPVDTTAVKTVTKAEGARGSTSAATSAAKPKPAKPRRNVQTAPSRPDPDDTGPVKVRAKAGDTRAKASARAGDTRAKGGDA